MVTEDSCCWDGWNVTVNIKRCIMIYDYYGEEVNNYNYGEDAYYYLYQLPEPPTCATTYCVTNDYYCPYYDIAYGCMSKYQYMKETRVNMSLSKRIIVKRFERHIS